MERLLPRKKEFRTHAHRNPFRESLFPVPISPKHVDWSLHFDRLETYANTSEFPVDYSLEEVEESKPVEIIDVGCGYGGLLFSLSRAFPQTRSFGMEIREVVTNYVAQKIHAKRVETGAFRNIGVIRTNAMKHLLNYIGRGQLLKLFFCFADPHYKKSNHRRRIINESLLSEYAYVLKPGGRIYSITDVPQLHDWNLEHLRRHPQYRELTPAEQSVDECVAMMKSSTEEGQKVQRNSMSSFSCVFERVIV